MKRDKKDRLLDDFGWEPVAARVDLGHHRWPLLKVTGSKSNGDMTMPSRLMLRGAYQKNMVTCHATKRLGVDVGEGP
jgi:hypothetical protein